MIFIMLYQYESAPVGLLRKLVKQGKIRREGGKRFGTWKVLSEKDFDKAI